jgi:GTPase SAR1 family protein
LKLVVVGDVTVGKTSLSKRLRAEIFSSDEAGTTSPQVVKIALANKNAYYRNLKCNRQTDRQIDRQTDSQA